MTEDDLEEAQEMLKSVIQEINKLDKVSKRLKRISIDYQKFVVDKMVGTK